MFTMQWRGLRLFPRLGMRVLLPQRPTKSLMGLLSLLLRQRVRYWHAFVRGHIGAQ